MADATTLGVTDIAQGEPRWRVVWRNAFPFLVVGAIWEIVARAGMFPAAAVSLAGNHRGGVLAAHRSTASCRTTRSTR